LRTNRIARGSSLPAGEKKMNKITFYLVGVFAFLLFTNTEIHACSCLPFGEETVARQVERAKTEARAVFSGKVVKIIKNPENHQITVQLAAAKSWKGNVPRRITITTASDSALCGYNFEVGNSYLIYAHGANAKNLQTNICTRTARIADAKADLKVLGKGKTPKG
jgi:molybdopterin-binding protein